MFRDTTGRYLTSTAGGERVSAFVPEPLPPMPPLELGGQRQTMLEKATLALGRLDSDALLLPDPQLFLYAYVRREAVLSSQIEGTQSSLSDLLLFELGETPGVPFDDVAEVSNYVAALEHGMARLREGFPLCNRLLRTGVGRTRPPANSAAARTGLAAPAPATPVSCHRPRKRSSPAWRRWSTSSTATRIGPTVSCRFYSRRRWPMSSSRPSTLSSMATDGWVAC